MYSAFRSLFFKEIRAAQGFVSEHAVQVRDCGQLPDERLFLTMDFVEGESLTQLLRREKTLMPRHALEIARQILLALSSGHEKASIHRDVKPSNVMLASRVPKTSENPHGVKVGLLDFGIASLTEEMEAGRGPGTPHYMSPEQAAAQSDGGDHRTDIYSLGGVLYEMLTLQRPYSGDSAHEVITAIMHRDPPPLRRVDRRLPRELELVCSTAMARDVEDRYASAAELAEDLRRFLAGLPTAARPTGGSLPLALPNRRSKPCVHALRRNLPKFFLRFQRIGR